MKQIEAQANNRMQAEAIKVAQELEDATEEAETWGNTIGTGEKSPPGQKLELGRRLAGNEKLKKLARMVGRMKFQPRRCARKFSSGRTKNSWKSSKATRCIACCRTRC